MSEVVEYFYAFNGERFGPVSSEKITELIESKVISHNSQLWTHGWPEWKAVIETEFSQLFDRSPPPLSAGQVSGGYAWVLAFSPLPAVYLQTLVAAFLAALFFSGDQGADLFTKIIQQHNGFVRTFNVLWIIPFLINVLLINKDVKAIMKAGYDFSSFKWWMWLLVPIYLYQRDRIVSGGVIRTIIWVIMFLLSLVVMP